MNRCNRINERIKKCQITFFKFFVFVFCCFSFALFGFSSISFIFFSFEFSLLSVK